MTNDKREIILSQKEARIYADSFMRDNAWCENARSRIFLKLNSYENITEQALINILLGDINAKLKTQAKARNARIIYD